MSNPIRFGAGGHRGAAASDEPEEEAHLLSVQLEHIQRLADALAQLYDQQRLRRRYIHTEWAYVLSGGRAEIGPMTQDQFRVTYIWAYAGAAATLHLKGGSSSDSLALPIPVATQPPLQVVLGDEHTGGLILERRDLRYVTTNDSSSQLIVAILAGEIMSDTYLS